jgi:hypothetical protein
VLQDAYNLPLIVYPTNNIVGLGLRDGYLDCETISCTTNELPDFAKHPTVSQEDQEVVANMQNGPGDEPRNRACISQLLFRLLRG